MFDASLQNWSPPAFCPSPSLTFTPSVRDRPHSLLHERRFQRSLLAPQMLSVLSSASQASVRGWTGNTLLRDRYPPAALAGPVSHCVLSLRLEEATERAACDSSHLGSVCSQSTAARPWAIPGLGRFVPVGSCHRGLPPQCAGASEGRPTPKERRSRSQRSRRPRRPRESTGCFGGSQNAWAPAAPFCLGPA